MSKTNSKIRITPDASEFITRKRIPLRSRFRDIEKLADEVFGSDVRVWVKMYWEPECCCGNCSEPNVNFKIKPTYKDILGIKEEDDKSQISKEKKFYNKLEEDRFNKLRAMRLYYSFEFTDDWETDEVNKPGCEYKLM